VHVQCIIDIRALRKLEIIPNDLLPALYSAQSMHTKLVFFQWVSILGQEDKACAIVRSVALIDVKFW
jgi:hypothetical protein